jgi:hypothetical protein
LPDKPLFVTLRPHVERAFEECNCRETRENLRISARRNNPNAFSIHVITKNRARREKSASLPVAGKEFQA